MDAHVQDGGISRPIRVDELVYALLATAGSGE
jgi:hypothetical protein